MSWNTFRYDSITVGELQDRYEGGKIAADCNADWQLVTSLVAMPQPPKLSGFDCRGNIRWVSDE